LHFNCGCAERNAQPTESLATGSDQGLGTCERLR